MSSTHGNQHVSDSEILALFDEIEGPFVTSSELAERLPISRTAINKRLSQLHEEGVLARKKPTAQMVGWWVAQSDAR